MPIAIQLGERKQEGEKTRRQAAHRKHQRQPAGVGVRTLFADPPNRDVMASAAASAPVRKIERPVVRILRVSGRMKVVVKAGVTGSGRA